MYSPLTTENLLYEFDICVYAGFCDELLLAVL
jgi:hypothetical protein